MKGNAMDSHLNQNVENSLQSVDQTELQDIAGGLSMIYGTFEPLPNRTEGCGTMIMLDRLIRTIIK